MPSGAKKRKAARKKKESQSVSNHSNGDDGVKHQDDKDSDVGELSSPNSQDHNSHQDYSSEGDEEENDKGENNSHTAAEEALKIKDSEEPSTVVKGDVVPVDREFEIEDKPSKKVDGGSSGISSASRSNNSRHSGSDDESHPTKKDEGAIDIASVVDLGNGNESLSGVPDSGNGNESLSGVPAENVADIDDGVDSAEKNFRADELKKTSNLGEKVETDISAPYIIEPMESDEKRLGCVEDSGTSTVFIDVPPKRKDESIENIVIPDLKERVAQEIHDGVAADVGVEVEKDSGVTEVLLVRGPDPRETTTWKSCCGLFEVFDRSGR